MQLSTIKAILEHKELNSPEKYAIVYIHGGRDFSQVREAHVEELGEDKEPVLHLIFHAGHGDAQRRDVFIDPAQVTAITTH